MANAEKNFLAIYVPPHVRLHEDGRVERLPLDLVTPSTDQASPVLSKDITISDEPPVSVRLFLPNSPPLPPSSEASKLPVLIYIHGGGFFFESTRSTLFHNYLASVTAEARVIVVSVEYRLAPECPIPAAYDDSWAAFEWVRSHSGGLGPEGWLNDHADLTRVFVAGDSAGGNVVHQMGLRNGERIESSKGPEQGFKLAGLIPVHPFFWGNDPLPGETTDTAKRAFFEGTWRMVNPATIGNEDPFINLEKDPNIARLGCSRVLVCVAENDALWARGWQYKDVLEKSGWKGEVEVFDAKGEDHVFHLFNPTCDNAVAMMKKVVEFINRA